MKKLFKIVGYVFGAFILAFIALAILGGHDRKPETQATASPPAQAATQSGPAPTPTPASAPPAPTSPKPIVWNTDDPDATSNGNIKLAIRSIKSGTDPLTGTKADASAVIKAPWKFYGQPICVAGTAGIVEDQPPGSDISKAMGTSDAAEIVIQTDEGTVVDLLSNRSSGNLKVGDVTTVCGLPAGRIEVPNQLGGKTTQLLLVGASK